MITSTLDSYPGKKVVQQLGIVTGYDDSISLVRTGSYSEAYFKLAIKDMEKAAKTLGANGILGISFSLGDRTRPFVMGTAVILEDE
ncbi:uncharacterized protein YbjQ (UPF0145 family) [Enterococcus sp. PF1-24]|uniref:heavy metal-binding domain-containing protein n=1 Tax=unclassified Enterococcus TaxID=2608891 RepID=UPI0024761565|nr:MULTISPECIES: heavy metal-binding domain-containing protein [unclassified Enterococcus]MDH6363819.1 uncharacterized protein YbjQ (UPF0145 family) [Enterococcus sp. PFB1-1]MDH6400995.1 uncharacterized protein YbjQ (UPF0145 family) [Enterococcus sp. PF1-24]